jgi:hypothetical protein
MFALKPAWPMGLTTVIPLSPCGIERGDGDAEIEKSVTKNERIVLLVVAPSGVPVTVTLVAWDEAGVVPVVVNVSTLEFPAVVGITDDGENEYVTPGGSVVPVSDKVTGFPGSIPLSWRVIFVEPEPPLGAKAFPELDSA